MHRLFGRLFGKWSPFLASLPRLHSSAARGALAPAASSSPATPSPIKTTLARLETLVATLRATTKTTEKHGILMKHPELHPLMVMICSPDTPFHITSKALDKRVSVDADKVPRYESIEALLEDLAGRRVSGHTAIAAVQACVATVPEHEELIRAIIDKNLKIRMGIKLVRRAVSGDRDATDDLDADLAAQPRASRESGKFPVSLGHPMGENLTVKPSYLAKSLQEDDRWLASRKLDGVRCLLHIMPGDPKSGTETDVRLYSRTGRELKNLEFFRQMILRDYGPLANGFRHEMPVLLDGELCVLEPGAQGQIDESFTKTLSAVLRSSRSTDEQIEQVRSRLHYLVFDCIEESEFFGYGDVRLLSDRLNRLESVFSHNNVSREGRIRIVDQSELASMEQLEELKAQAAAENWEGVIVRRDCDYNGKRSRDILKVKTFQEAEFTVVGHVVGPVRFIDAGVERVEEMLSSVVIDYKGGAVNVGSGFSIEQRRRFAAHPEEIVGKLVTVQYFEETKDQKTGVPSLRFPTLKDVHQGSTRDY